MLSKSIRAFTARFGQASMLIAATPQRNFAAAKLKKKGKKEDGGSVSEIETVADTTVASSVHSSVH